MLIDARGIDQKDLFGRLKEILSANRECQEISIEVLTVTPAEAQKVKGFAVMSGCQAEIHGEGDHYRVHVTGAPCCS